MPFYCLLLILLAIILALAFFRANLAIWTTVLAVFIVGLGFSGMVSTAIMSVYWLIFAIVFLPLNILPLRRHFISRHVFATFRNMMPPMSDTEKQALDAGSVWWDAQLFSGKPDWNTLLDQPTPQLSAAEQAFVDGPVEELCAMLDDWKINHELCDLPPEVWTFIRKNGFFGMIIPKAYGGLEFSAQAHSAVVMKVSSRSIAAAVTVMVPNSLGPGQLLLNYGTDAQKNHYLPRLASGDDIPCFALTSQWAGSDAAAMRDTGMVCKREFAGKETVGILLNWEKRYITLAPVATVLGLAFKLYDPDHLLGEKESRGITLALIPTDTAGIDIGKRHLPLGQAFQNGPVSGRDVFIPLDWIIGGIEYAGQGWRMLMECLADGRAISLPSLSSGASKVCSRAAGAYARIRTQFHTPIGRMEGVEEVLARIAANTYAIDATRQLTVIAVDQGEKPSVMSAIAKYHCTERMRNVVNDAMDVFGGAAIITGPLNLMARTYAAIPISITVEGANILTRSLIIFGQGVVRCHPYLRHEMDALAMSDKNDENNEKAALQAFDRAFFAHLGFTGSNKVRSLLLGLSNGRLSRPPFAPPLRRYAQQIERFSSHLAFVSDITLAVLGGGLKRQEKLSGRLGDVLSQLYIACAAIKRFVTDGSPTEDLPLLQWVCEDALWRAQQALDAFLNNFPVRSIAIIMRAIVFPLGKPLQPPSDKLGRKLADIVLEQSPARDKLTDGIYINNQPEDPLGRIEHAFAAVLAASNAAKKMKQARKSGQLDSLFDDEDALAELLDKGLIDEAEAELLRRALAATWQATIVDAFAADNFAANGTET
ncbi:MAG: acyl-CoA dehydrogenase, partial [Mariprofundaceae bacterium]|nr:acyl-CoA dehydrogenase [Mariprofundaceae bacterium]